MSARERIESPIGDDCENCEEIGEWRFLCSYHEGWADCLDQMQGLVLQAKEAMPKDTRTMVMMKGMLEKLQEILDYDATE